jgi:hypothetical protein
MKVIQSIAYLLLFLFLVVDTSSADSSTNIMRAVTYYFGTENLGGKLVFLVEHEYNSMTNSKTAATIYELDLLRGQERPITDCPNGQFISSSSGKMFAVVYMVGDSAAGYGSDTNVFVYSEALGLGRTTNIECSPQDCFIADGYVYFQLEGYNFPSDGHYLSRSNRLTETKLVLYDVTNNQVRIADVPYSHFRNQETEPYSFKAFNGQYIFFKGRNAPIEGTVLLSSPLDSIESEIDDPKGEKVKVLHRFPMLGPYSGAYELLQLSPDRHYALVRILKPLTGKGFSDRSGSNKTYYLVDTSTGKTRVLLEDKSEADTKSSVSKVWWVQ